MERGGEAPGVEYPESEDGALVRAAVEVAGEEGADVVEHFLRLSGHHG